jgi:hypothetical protein
MAFGGIHKFEKDGQQKIAFNLLNASKDYSIPLTTLTGYAKNKHDEAGNRIVTCDFLPEGYLPTVKRKPPVPFGGREETTVLKEDMDRLQAAMQAAAYQPSLLNPSDGLKTAKEIAAHYGLTATWDYAKLGVLLRRLRDSGQFAQSKTRRFSKKRRRCWRPFGYSLEVFDYLLGGRDLNAILDELTPDWAHGDNVVLRQGYLAIGQGNADRLAAPGDGRNGPQTTIVSDVVKLVQTPPLAEPLLAIDQTGVGVAVVDQFRQAQPRARLVPILITGGHEITWEGGAGHVPNKELVSSIQVLFQARRLKVANVPERETLVKELINFRVKITISANETFEAWRERDHDDMVLAVALAAWLAEDQPPPNKAPEPVDDGLDGPIQFFQKLGRPRGSWA